MFVNTQATGSRPDLRRVRLNPDYWFPVAQSGQVRKGGTLAVGFGAEPIALGRTASNTVFALEDRCAHRQFPLSKGVVCGEHIQCGYHAWRYSASGQIVGLPYPVPGGVAALRGVRSYPCREAYGHIFVFPGDAARAAESPFPELRLFGSPDYKVMFFSRRIRCHYSFLHENLMDMNHQFLHRRLMGSVKPRLLSHAKGDDWVEARYHFDHQGGKKHRGMHWMSLGADADETAFDVMTIRTQYPYQTLTVSGEDGQNPSLALWTVYVPVEGGDRSCHSFGILLLRKPRLRWLLTLVWPVLRHFTESVFAEDRMAVEAEQLAYDQQSGDWNQEIFPVLLDLRELLIRKGRPSTL